MENKIKLVGVARYVKERQAKTGMIVTSFMVECQNNEGYTAKIPVTAFGLETRVTENDQVTVLGCLRNAKFQKPGQEKPEFRLEAVAEKIQVNTSDIPF
jgi:hypothetical protein